MTFEEFSADMKAKNQSDMNAYREEGAVAMIKNFLDAGTPIEYIRKASGWTDDAILALRDSM